MLEKSKTEISREADFLLRPVRPRYGGQVAPSSPLAMSARGAKRKRGKRRRGRVRLHPEALPILPSETHCFELGAEVCRFQHGLQLLYHRFYSQRPMLFYRLPW